jgi:quinol monooxygenase YgiN
MTLPGAPGQHHMLIIAGELRVAPEDRDAYVADCVVIVEAARRAPGCLDFAITADSAECDRITVYERWDSDEELLAFRGSGPDADTGARIRSADVRKYRISGVEEP